MRRYRSVQDKVLELEVQDQRVEGRQIFLAHHFCPLPQIGERLRFELCWWPNMPHFFTLVRPIRENFPADMTPEEYSVIGEHIAYLQKNCEDGVVLLAGPTRDKDPIGLAVIEVPDLEAAEAFLANDPAVVKGLFKADAPRPYSIAVMRGLNEETVV